jgi:hypothetical protein
VKAAWEIVAELYEAKQTALAVLALTDAELVAVRGFLVRDFDEHGLSGLLLGICLVEQAERFELWVQKEGPPNLTHPTNHEGEGFL